MLKIHFKEALNLTFYWCIMGLDRVADPNPGILVGSVSVSKKALIRLLLRFCPEQSNIRFFFVQKDLFLSYVSNIFISFNISTMHYTDYGNDVRW